MKNYLKYIVAVFGITIATFGTITAKAGTTKPVGTCPSYGFCGTTDSGATINGNYKP
jgi:hypothetical protein